LVLFARVGPELPLSFRIRISQTLLNHHVGFLDTKPQRPGHIVSEAHWIYPEFPSQSSILKLREARLRMVIG
jgi:hypothetical protein